MDSTTLTPVALDTLNRADLARLYNTLAERPVKAFSTLTAARDRVTAKLAETGRSIFHDGVQLVTGVVEPDAAPIVAPEALGEVASSVVTESLDDMQSFVVADGEIDPANLPELTTLEHKMLSAIVAAARCTITDAVDVQLYTSVVVTHTNIKPKQHYTVLKGLEAKGFVHIFDPIDEAGLSVSLTRRGAVALAASETPVGAEPSKAAPAPAAAVSAPRAEPAPRPARVPGAPRVAGGRTLLDPADRRGPVPSFDDDCVIKLLVAANPKRPGAATYAMFDIYHDGMTVADYVSKGGRRRELNWDVRNGWVAVERPGA